MEWDTVRKVVRSAAFWVAVTLVVLFVASRAVAGSSDREELRYDEFVDRVEAGDVAEAEVKDKSSRIIGELADGREFETAFVSEAGDQVVELLAEADVPYKVDAEESSFWTSLVLQLLPILLIVGVFLFFLNSMQGGGSRLMQFGKSKAKQV
ncbi:MAG: ATP-dependent metallopeptidase FtsH/Yme1/Tma family protein, partial [Actinobacteria bacterium]|nr:ATP-dependent metallopeptidase FtsH/Yme1/Tma family protein [Actinomycetota bacterium]